MEIVGIVQPKEDAGGAMLMPGLYYPASLTDHVIEKDGKQDSKGSAEAQAGKCFHGKIL